MQEQLGDIGEDLGLAQPSPAEPDYTSQPADDVRRENIITCLNSKFSLLPCIYLHFILKDFFDGMYKLSPAFAFDLTQANLRMGRISMPGCRH